MLTKQGINTDSGFVFPWCSSSERHGPTRRIPMLCGLLVLAMSGLPIGAAIADTRYQVLELGDTVERATGPVELLSLDADAAITLRALRAFGKLPDEFNRLALSLRGSGIDLFAAGEKEVEALLGQVRAGSLSADAEALERLLQLLRQRDYLDWQPLTEGEQVRLSDTTRLRGQGRALLQPESGEPLLFDSHLGVQALSDLRAMDTDVKGLPTPAVALSSRDEEIRVYWHERLDEAREAGWLYMDGEPEFTPLPGDQLRVVLPAVSLRTPLDLGPHQGIMLMLDSPVMTLDMGHAARPAFEIRLPASIPVHDRDGDEVGLFTMGRPVLTGVWARDLDTLLKVTVDTGPMQLGMRPEPSSQPSALKGADVPLPGRDELEQFAAEGLRLTLDLAQGSDGRFKGPLEMQLLGLTAKSVHGIVPLRLGAVTLKADYQDLDLVALNQLTEQLGDDPEVLFLQDPEGFFSRMITAMGVGGTELGISDLEIRNPDGAGEMHLALARLGSRWLSSGPERLERDLQIALNLENWRFEDDEMRFGLDALAVEGGLQRISPVTLFRLGLASAMGGELPGEEVLRLSQSLVGGFRLSVDLKGGGVQMLAGSSEGGERMEVGHFSFGLDGTDLDTPTPGLKLAYRHQDVTQILADMNPLPERLFPGLVEIDLSATGLPAGMLADDALMTQIRTGQVDVMEALITQLISNASLLALDKVLIDMPAGRISMNGRGTAERLSAEEAGMLAGTLNIEVRDLDALAEQWAAQAGDEDERRQIRQMAAFLKMMGEPRQEGSGETVHVFRIKADTRGEITVNDNDLAPLLEGFGG